MDIARTRSHQFHIELRLADTNLLPCSNLHYRVSRCQNFPQWLNTGFFHFIRLRTALILNLLHSFPSLAEFLLNSVYNSSSQHTVYSQLSPIMYKASFFPLGLSAHLVSATFEHEAYFGLRHQPGFFSRICVVFRKVRAVRDGRPKQLRMAFPLLIASCSSLIPENCSWIKQVQAIWAFLLFVRKIRFFLFCASFRLSHNWQQSTLLFTHLHIRRPGLLDEVFLLAHFIVFGGFVHVLSVFAPTHVIFSGMSMYVYVELDLEH